MILFLFLLLFLSFFLLLISIHILVVFLFGLIFLFLLLHLFESLFDFLLSSLKLFVFFLFFQSLRFLLFLFLSLNGIQDFSLWPTVLLFFLNTLSSINSSIGNCFGQSWGGSLVFEGGCWLFLLKQSHRFFSFPFCRPWRKDNILLDNSSFLEESYFLL